MVEIGDLITETKAHLKRLEFTSWQFESKSLVACKENYLDLYCDIGFMLHPIKRETSLLPIPINLQKEAFVIYSVIISDELIAEWKINRDVVFSNEIIIKRYGKDLINFIEQFLIDIVKSSLQIVAVVENADLSEVEETWRFVTKGIVKHNGRIKVAQMFLFNDKWIPFVVSESPDGPWYPINNDVKVYLRI